MQLRVSVDTKRHALASELMRRSARARATVKTEQGPPPHYGKGPWPFDRVAFPRLRANRIEAAKGVASHHRKETTMSNKQTAKTNLPSHRIYAVSSNGGEKSAWQEIGAVWPHKDGKGFNLQFAARPLEGAAIVLRAVTPKPATAKKAA